MTRALSPVAAGVRGDTVIIAVGARPSHNGAHGGACIDEASAHGAHGGARIDEAVAGGAHVDETTVR